MVKKVCFGTIHADEITFADALDAIADLVRAKKGGYVVTPNVDHVVQAESNAALRQCYADASLSLVDGKPLLWLARLMGHPLPEKISGSDLFRPLMTRAAAEGWGVYFLGAAEGVGRQAADILLQENPQLKIVGVSSPAMGFDKDPQQREAVAQEVRAAKPELVMLALGCPKQELLMHAWRHDLAPAVCLGIGASFDFVAGRVKRAPRWMSEIGFEWAYRLSQDPKRLARRYLHDLSIAGVAWRMLQRPHADRAIES